jgi:type IV secretion system protein VirB10
MSDDKEQDITKACANLSKVTGKSKQWMEKGGFAGLCAICLIIFGVMVFPSHSKEREVEPSDKTHSLDSTLKDNLETANALQEKKAQQYRQKLIRQSELQALAPIHKDVIPPPRMRQPQAHKPKGIPKEVLVRMNASTTFFVPDASFKASSHSHKDKSGAVEASILSQGSNSAFLNSKGEFAAVQAKQIAHPDYSVPAGEFIRGTLETAISSELPGMIKATTSHDIYSLTGARKLIPKGSKLLGQFNSGVVLGQTRLLVIWNRVQLPNGVVVDLNSPGTDGAGRAGLGADVVNGHFIERFGGSVLLSVLGFYSATSGVSNADQFNSKSQYRSMLSGGLQAASQDQLNQSMSIQTTLLKHQGAEVNIFVAHDLSFYQVMREAV